MRLLFVSDTHSSKAVWQSALDMAQSLSVDLLILGGDHVGKYLAPIVKQAFGWQSSYGERDYSFSTEQEVIAFENQLWRWGIYSKRVKEDEFQRMSEDLRFRDDTFLECICERMDALMRMVRGRGNDRPKYVLVSPGNDDPFHVDEIIKRHEANGVFFGGSNVVNIDGCQLVSLEYTTLTPWDTPRELSESELSKQIDLLIRQCSGTRNLIFNFHCPPYETSIDQAPELTAELRPVIRAGSVSYKSVGSKAILKAIQKYQPICSLHGHVHESPGRIHVGKTLCFNPGSEYESGNLRAYAMVIEQNEVQDSWLITS